MVDLFRIQDMLLFVEEMESRWRLFGLHMVMRTDRILYIWCIEVIFCALFELQILHEMNTPEPYDEEKMVKEYRRFGAGKGLPIPDFIRELNIFYAAVVTVVLCILAIVMSITFAICFWILDKALWKDIWMADEKVEDRKEEEKKEETKSGKTYDGGPIPKKGSSK